MRYFMVLKDADIARFVCRDPGIVPFVDLESLGKAERQGHLPTWKSTQTISDVSLIREAVPDAKLLVRVDPLHSDSKAQIDDVIARGADMVMLPMFEDADTVARFLDFLAGRAKAVPLFETAHSVQNAPEIAEKLGLEHLHIGLNDLSLDLGLDFLFQPLSNGLLEAPCAALRNAGIQFGIGGLARAREGIVSPEYLLGEHVRLGSTSAILSQTFHRNPADLAELQSNMDFFEEMSHLRRIHTGFLAMSHQALERNRHETWDRISDVSQLIRARKEAQV
jgi:hypothetical protein